MLTVPSVSSTDRPYPEPKNWWMGQNIRERGNVMDPTNSKVSVISSYSNVCLNTE